MKAQDKAIELIQDFIAMQPRFLDKIGMDKNSAYEYAKSQAHYCVHQAKHSHNKESECFNYWIKVKNEIDKL